MNQSVNPACHVCGSADLETVDRYKSFRRVASDCTPWPAGGKLGICFDCRCVQAVTDDKWRHETTEIYRQYTIWHQSGGAEQGVFDQSSGQATARSRRILERLSRDFRLAPRGRLLDICCGNGSLLKTAGEILPGWSLAGTEFGDKHRLEIEALPGVERLYTGPLGDVPGQFDLITLSHVFEHLIAPHGLLDAAARMLRPGGMLLIQVPNYTENPFELLVADHCSHFCPATLAAIVEKAGYSVRMIASDWVPREITLVAYPGHEGSTERPLPDAQTVLAMVDAELDWLERMRTAARRIYRRPFGIFGTSIAGTWLYSEVGDRVSFFVDEDPQRAGKTHLGMPIVLPRHAPPGSSIFVALADPLAATVSARLREQTAPGVQVLTLNAHPNR